MQPLELDNNQNGYALATVLQLVHLPFVALAIYIRSPAAYQVLQSFGILKLPSKSTLQSYSGAFIHEPGASTACIADQVSCFVAFIRVKL